MPDVSYHFVYTHFSAPAEDLLPWSQTGVLAMADPTAVPWAWSNMRNRFELNLLLLG